MLPTSKSLNPGKHDSSGTFIQAQCRPLPWLWFPSYRKRRLTKPVPYQYRT